MHLLRQSTVATVLVGPVLDSSGAAVTTAVVGDFRIAKEGSAAILSGATVTHDANGYYRIALTTANTDTVGRLAIYSNNTAQSMGTTRFMVLLPSVYDAIVANAVNTTGGLIAATAAVTSMAGAISTYGGGDTAGTTTLLSRLTSARAGYLDGVLLAANYNQRTVQVTGGPTPHIAASIHNAEANSIPAGALTTAAIAEIQSGLATAANQTTILARLGAFTGTGINTVLGFLRAMASKAASTPSDIGGTYSATTDSLEAIRDAQAAGTGDASQATLEAVQDTVDAIAAKVSGGLIEVTSRVATGGSITLYIGDDARVRSGTEIEVTISDVGGIIYSRLNALGVGNLAWGASRRGLNAGAISGTISGLSQSGSGATQALTFAIEINDAGDDLLPHDEYTWQIVSTSAAGDEWVEVEGMLDLRRRVAVPV